ncbi:uncharacterized protein N7459_001603 [Penicillium hispanicum]|uniref:uncharacterized protein n=1 Tax=Penicillium hispanicum TaxID=1080232 RepID=UPI0025409E70|nr:uncharacterized protein N7459_001603 [Penicillium hispanicum]KAJ5595395.1 hypothetical protein N7459_001603 [Penicillium hispanicum]
MSTPPKSKSKGSQSRTNTSSRASHSDSSPQSVDLTYDLTCIDLTSDEPIDKTINTSLSAKLGQIYAFQHGSLGDRTKEVQRNDWLTLQRRECPTQGLAEAVVDDIVYRPSMTVELRNGNYLRIEVIRSRCGVFFLYGRYLMKSTEIPDRYVPNCKGELIWLPQRTEPISLDQIKGFCKVVFTNFRKHDWKDHDHLVCRLKVIWRSRDMIRTDLREALVTPENTIEYLLPEETDKGFGLTSRELRDNWRGVDRTKPFGDAEVSWSQMMRQQRVVIDLENPERETIDLTDMRLRTYTFGDAYCGAGGASCGARQAGLKLIWSFDAESQATDSYKRNFPGTTVWNAPVDHFLAIEDAGIPVDVCHASPPCQPFSPAHTVHNEPRDEINSACVFTATDLLKTVRPRILTMEETFGLLERHKEVFHRVILDFIELGYSVRWAVLECVNYGVPQWRKRLIILVAGPGESLPNLPPPTHALPGAGLLPLNTISNAIDGIPLDAEDHDVEKGLQSYQMLGHREPYNKLQPARTVTCSGGEYNYHPSGRRGFTAREFACLQTFPVDFQFSDQKVRKQIGNAVPPKFAEAVFREVCRSLRETDEKELEKN